MAAEQSRRLIAGIVESLTALSCGSGNDLINSKMMVLRYFDGTQFVSTSRVRWLYEYARIVKDEHSDACMRSAQPFDILGPYLDNGDPSVAVQLQQHLNQFYAGPDGFRHRFIIQGHRIRERATLASASAAFYHSANDSGARTSYLQLQSRMDLLTATRQWSAQGTVRELEDALAAIDDTSEDWDDQIEEYGELLDGWNEAMDSYDESITAWDADFVTLQGTKPAKGKPDLTATPFTIELSGNPIVF
jgi:hypothetical protein